MQIALGKALEERLNKELPYVPLFVKEEEGKYDVVITAYIADRVYDASIYQIVHEGIDTTAKAIVSMFTFEAISSAKSSVIEGDKQC